MPEESVLFDISPLPHHLFLWEHCFYATWRISSKLCSGHFLLAISCIMPLESFWHLRFGIIGHSVNISAQFTVFLKPMSYFSLLRVKCDKERCVSCGKCKRVCPMNVDVTDNSCKRENGTECILCMECVKACPKKAL